jgi:hypothetical protein
MVQSILIRAKLVISLPLFSISKHSHSVANSLKGFSSSRYLVLVWMQLQSQLLVRLLDVRVSGLFGNTQYFVVVLAPLDALHRLNLVSSVVCWCSVFSSTCAV